MSSNFVAPCPFQPDVPVWLYFRDSGGDSQDLFSQKAKVLEYCQAYQLRIERIFEDAATSGRSIARRADFNEMITLAQSAKRPLVKGIICWDMSRFSRSMDDGPYYRRMLEMIGYKLVFISVFIPEGITGKIVETGYDIANALLLERISTDSKRGLQLLIDMGVQKNIPFWPGRVPRCFLSQQYPTGRKLNDGSEHTSQIIIPDHDTWPLGQLAFEMRASRHTYEEIAQATRLFDEVRYGRPNHLANSMQGKSLVSRVSSFFGQTIYKGTLTWKGQQYSGYVEALVSTELWEAANSYRYHRGEPFHSVPHPKAGRTGYLLSGLLRCAYCNQLLYGVHSMDRRGEKVYHKWFYKCNSLSYGQEKCGNKIISCRKIEPKIIGYILDEYLDFDFITRLLQGIREKFSHNEAMEREIARLETEVDELQARIRNIRERIERGDSTAWVWYRERESQLQQVQTKLKELRGQKPKEIPYIGPEVIEAALTKLRQMVSSEHLRDRQLILQSIIARIDVAREQAVINIKPPIELFGVYSNIPPALVLNLQHTIEL